MLTGANLQLKNPLACYRSEPALPPFFRFQQCIPYSKHLYGKSGDRFETQVYTSTIWFYSKCYLSQCYNNTGFLFIQLICCWCAQQISCTGHGKGEYRGRAQTTYPILAIISNFFVQKAPSRHVFSHFCGAAYALLKSSGFVDFISENQQLTIRRIME